MSVAQLIATVVTTPDLPGAACVDHLDVFDACVDRGATFAYDQAIQICASQCPALAACSRWYHSLPDRKRPYGVTAGQIRRSSR
ncbi:MAG TPA: hypothetical protein VLL82_10130 [Mycobacterium sp.]|nr:hypothetical protein [Mycobacterium sp.]